MPILSGILRRITGQQPATQPAPALATNEALLHTDPALPVHVVADHGELRMEEGRLSLVTETEERTLRLDEISMLALHGNISITTPCLRALLDRGIPVLFHSRGGHYLGQLVDLSGNHSAVRRAHYAAATDRKKPLEIARQLVAAKIANARRLLRRRGGGSGPVVRRLTRHLRAARKARSLEKLRGVEGAAAALYWESWPKLIKADPEIFLFEGRNRRPPRDAVNAALSYASAVLAGQCAAAALAAGLDPFVGFLHGERAGRPSLALDLVEPFRPAVAESAVLTAINGGELDADCFDFQSGGGVFLSDIGRKAVLAALERRLSTRFAYPGIGREVSWRAAVSLHAQLLSRALREGKTEFSQPVID